MDITSGVVIDIEIMRHDRQARLACGTLSLLLVIRTTLGQANNSCEYISLTHDRPKTYSYVQQRSRLAGT